MCTEVFCKSVLGGEKVVFAEAFRRRVCGSVPRKCSRKIRGRGFIAGQCLDGVIAHISAVGARVKVAQFCL